MFLLMDSLSQGICCITRLNRYLGLQDNRPPVQLRCDKMYADAMNVISRFKDPLVGIEALIFGKERGMNIQHAAIIMIDEICG